MGGKLLQLLARFAPGVVAKHVQKRVMADTLLRSYYNAAGMGRGTEGWPVSNARAEATNRASRDIVRARARDLERNTDILTAEILALERNVVGTGIVLQAKVRSGDNEDELVNERIEAAWDEWCKPKYCDASGRQSLPELCRMAVRRMFVDGAMLLIACYVRGTYCLQAHEVDELDTSVLEYDGHRVTGGVEIDAYGCPVAYHIRVLDDYGWTGKTYRVDAARVIYLAPITRPGQVREFSPLAPSLARIDDVNEFLAAALEKERTLSFLALFVKPGADGSSFGGLGRGASMGAAGGGGAGGDELVLEQGAIKRLNAGEEIQTVAPTGTSSTATDMVRAIQRMAGSSAGLSYESVSRDLSQVNYSSARQGLLEDQRTYAIWQQQLIVHFLDRIYEEWLDWAVVAGRVELPDYWERRSEYQRHEWYPNGWKWIDPVKEANANAKALETGQTTLQEIAAGQGKDYRDVVKQRAREIKLMAALMGGQEAAKEQRQPERDAADSGGPQEKAPPDENTADLGDGAAAEVASKGTTIQSVSLNGAQLSALVEITQLVGAGQFPYSSAMALLTSAFPFDEETAERILNKGVKAPSNEEGGENDAEQ